MKIGVRYLVGYVIAVVTLLVVLRVGHAVARLIW